MDYKSEVVFIESLKTSNDLQIELISCNKYWI